MRLYHSLMHPGSPMNAARSGRAGRRLLCVLMLLAGTALTAAAQSETPESLRTRALDLAYNLDHEPAIALLRRAVEIAPGDPAGHRNLASVLWLNMLFQRGAVTVDHYLGSFSRARVDLKKPPPELDAEFRRHVDIAVSLAEKRVAANARDPQAHYDLGTALGLRASYIATVDGKLLAGFTAARKSFDEHEKVLELAPSRADAGLIVGTYRYVISTLSLPMRMMAYVVGFGGGREMGIEMLRATAASNTDARTDAMFALVLVYNRERRYDEALRVLADLRRLYPRNRLVVLEAGATALRAGRGAEADAMLTEGLGMMARETRPRIPGEEALWRYKRGAARVALGRVDAAMDDLRAASAPGAQPWVSGRARVELGRLALRKGDRTAAATHAREAESLCREGNDPECVGNARTLLRSANGR